MRFSITGANKETGEDVQVELTATSRYEAEQAAKRQGIMVSEIKLLQEEKDTSALSMDDDGPGVDGEEGDTGGGYWKEAAAKGGGSGQATIAMSGGQGASSDAKQPMEYHIVMNQAMYLLEKAVNKYLADGWEPAGGLTVGISNNATQFYQAIKRRNKVEEEGEKKG